MAEGGAPRVVPEEGPVSTTEGDAPRKLTVWDRTNSMPAELKNQIMKMMWEDGRTRDLQVLWTTKEFYAAFGTEAWKHAIVNLNTIDNPGQVLSNLRIDNRREVRHIVFTFRHMCFSIAAEIAHPIEIFPVTSTYIWPYPEFDTRNGYPVRQAATNAAGEPNPPAMRVGLASIFVYGFVLQGISLEHSRYMQIEGVSIEYDPLGVRTKGIFGQFLDNPRLRSFTVKTVNPDDHNEVWWELVMERLDRKDNKRLKDDPKLFRLDYSYFPPPSKIEHGAWLNDVKLGCEQVENKPWEFHVTIGHETDLPDEKDWILVHVKETKILAPTTAASSSA